MAHHPSTDRFLKFASLVTQTTQGHLPLSVLLDSLLDAAMETLDGERAFIVAEDKKHNLRPIRSRNFRAPVSTAEANDLFSQTAVRLALKEEEQLVIPDISADPRLNRASSVEELGLSAVVVQPLVLRNKLLGVLVIDSRTLRGCPYTEDRMILFGALAAQAALTLNRYQGEIVKESAEENQLKRKLRLNHRIIGQSKAMKGVVGILERAAQCSSNVLILGETGTGKEVFARSLHEGSSRRDGPFVAESMAALPETLMESTLFGHEAGAFTDAKTRKQGLFQLAHRGTLFLDEVGEASMAVQTKLLRVLQERTLRPLGSEKEIEVDVRVIAATNRDLGAMVKASTFREDLYYRLNVLQMNLPPLRERPEDIPDLAHHFLREVKARNPKAADKLTREALDLLRTHRWSGNVRELGNVIERAAVLATGKIRAEDIRFEEPSAEPGRGRLNQRLSEFKKHLERFFGNVGLAAKAMNVPTSTAFEWRKKLEKSGEIERRPGR